MAFFVVAAFVVTVKLARSVRVEAEISKAEKLEQLISLIQQKKIRRVVADQSCENIQYSRGSFVLRSDMGYCTSTGVGFPKYVEADGVAMKDFEPIKRWMEEGEVQQVFASFKKNGELETANFEGKPDQSRRECWLTPCSKLYVYKPNYKSFPIRPQEAQPLFDYQRINKDWYIEWHLSD
ncbi:hypothetical protein [Leptothermofonsia sp. ETS-13]|uniref:hypothetical protein n=1 Tax=Leptothermofonsia sp. ETS-13 TaxID=3035696 RepID=UPI003BA3ACC4